MGRDRCWATAVNLVLEEEDILLLVLHSPHSNHVMHKEVAATCLAYPHRHG